MKKKVDKPPMYKITSPIKMSRFSENNDVTEKVNKRFRIKDVIKDETTIEIKKEILSPVTLNDTGYLLLAIEEAIREYGISYFEALLLMYLYELGGFELHVAISMEEGARKKRLDDFKKYGYIERAVEGASKYKLTPKAIEIVSFIYDKAGDPERYSVLVEGPATDSTVDVTSALQSIFS